MKTYALVEDNEVVDFRTRDEISSEEWNEKDWRIVYDNSSGIDSDQYYVSSSFDIIIHKRKVIKTHEIVPLNRKTKKILQGL